MRKVKLNISFTAAAARHFPKLEIKIQTFFCIQLQIGNLSGHWNMELVGWEIDLEFSEKSFSVGILWVGGLFKWGRIMHRTLPQDFQESQCFKLPFIFPFLMRKHLLNLLRSVGMSVGVGQLVTLSDFHSGGISGPLQIVSRPRDAFSKLCELILFDALID